MATRLDLAPDLVLWQGDVREALRQMPDGVVQCVVTSPPYYGLRDYGTARWEGGDPNCRHEAPAWADDPGDLPGMSEGGALGANAAKWHRRTGGICPRCGARRVDRQIGLEPTVEEYVQTLVEVFREVRRILRPDGTLWLNLGDSYNGSGGAGGDYGPGGLREGQPRYPGRRLDGLKPKDLLGVPWRVAFALQADGWYLRSDIIWAKPNPMPESVLDRPTRAHEYVFLLSKSPHYYYDADAIREPARSERSGNQERVLATKRGRPAGASGAHRGVSFPWENTGLGRNRRSVWTIATQPFPDAHFATFPEELPRLCILAGTSPYACPHCGAPWRRVVERVSHSQPVEERHGRVGHNGMPPQQSGWFWTPPTVIGQRWEPTCACDGNDGSGRCIVLDPFWGSGTTGLVALELGRIAWGVELNPQYIEISLRRLKGAQTTLLGRV